MNDAEHDAEHDAQYIELIFREFDIEGWKFLQTNPNGTYTFQCSSCEWAFALPSIDSIINYRYCPSCAKYMRKVKENI